MFDVTIIGGGVVGGLILRELTKYQLSVCMLEKENDVCMGASKANSGIVHAGYDATTGSLKAKFNVLGNEMMEALCANLGVKFERNGSLVVVFDEGDKDKLERLKARGEANGVKGLKIIDKSDIKSFHSCVSEKVVAALYAPSAGIVCPYTLTIAAIGNAMDNGASLMTNFEVCAIEREGESFVLRARDGRRVESKLVVNCAGYNGEKIASFVKDEHLQTSGRKGEYILLDRGNAEAFKSTLFCLPTKKGKGILVAKTVDGNILLGPTAEEVDFEDKSTSAEGLEFVQKKAEEMCKHVPFSTVVTSFTGVRAYSHTHDFVVEESRSEPGFFHCIGIDSPGLTAAPALAKYVVEELISVRLPLKINPEFDGKRAPDYFFKDLSTEAQNALIKKNPSYGKVVCRCEGITEGEILRAIRENPPASDIDGVKRRTRAGLGRCQGGFCQPYVLELIAKERKIPLEEVTKSGGKSRLLVGVTK